MRSAAALGLVVALGGCGDEDAAAYKAREAQRTAFREAIAPLYAASSKCPIQLPEAFLRREVSLVWRQMRFKLKIERDPAIGPDAKYVADRSDHGAARPKDCPKPQTVFSPADIKAISDGFDRSDRELDDAARAASLYKSQIGA